MTLAAGPVVYRPREERYHLPICSHLLKLDGEVGDERRLQPHFGKESNDGFRPRSTAPSS